MRDLAAEAQAATLEACAGELEERAREWQFEQLTLEEAVAESGYSYSQLQALVAEGTLPNAGKAGSPRILRRDLPRRPGVAPSEASDLVERVLASRMA